MGALKAFHMQVPQGSRRDRPGPDDEQKQYSPRERESTMEDLQTVRHSSKDGAERKRSGIIKTQKVIEKRNEVKSL